MEQETDGLMDVASAVMWLCVSLNLKVPAEVAYSL